MYLAKRYLDTAKSNVKIKLAISFNKDRFNWATNESKKIGYQVTATPVEIADRGNGITTELSGAFTGFNDCLLAVERQSKKRLEQAIDILDTKIEMYKDFFRNKGYEFLD